MSKFAIQFNEIAKTNQAVLDKFAKDFAYDPTYALSWSNSVFQAAARVKVAKELATAFENPDVDVVRARAYLTDRVLNRARYPAQSTSPTANLMEQYESAAYAEALEVLNYE